jgi:YbbR domain-containing protein
LTKNKSFLDGLVSNWPAKALSLVAAIMLFIFNNFSSLSERFISVELHTVFADELTAAQPYPRRVRVEIRGNDRSLSAATEEDIRAIADFSRFTAEGVYTTPVTIQKRGVLSDLDAIEIRVDPLEITLPVEKKVRKRVSVVPVFKGLPATGYRLERYTVDPPGVDLEGPAGIVQSINSISTEDIDLSGKRGNFNARIRLVSENPLLMVPGGDTVDFSGQILEAAEMRTFEDIPVTLQGLSQSFLLDAEPPHGWITIQGGQSLFERFEKKELELVVNCAGLSEPGIYNLTVRPVVPQGMAIAQFSPDHIALVIQRGGRVEFQ